MLEQALGQAGAVRRRLEAFRHQGGLGGVFEQHRVARQRAGMTELTAVRKG